MNQFRSSQASEDGEVRVPRGSEAVQTLRKQLERVERESVTLQRIASGLDDFVHQQEGRLAELEQELNDTALLYVASEQFHAALDPKHVAGYVRELLEQLLGAEIFVVYLRLGVGDFKPIVWRGISDKEVLTQPLPLGPLESAVASGRSNIVQGRPLPTGSLTTPIAAVPLMLEERAVGALLIAKLFAHKEGWAPVDQQLLHLLSSRAAPALVAAHLIRTQSDLLGTLAGVGESLR